MRVRGRAKRRHKLCAEKTRNGNVRDHLKYICSAYFGNGDNDCHFNCTVKAIIDLKFYKSVKFISSEASVVNHSYSNVETKMLPFL